MGKTAKQSTATSSLTLSPAVTDSVQRALAHIRGPSPTAQQTADEPPNFPSAFPVGRFLTKEKSPTSRFLSQGVAMHPLPQSHLPVSFDDKFLLPPHKRLSSNQSASLPDKQLVEWESLSLESLKAVSALDSILAGLIAAIQRPNTNSSVPQYKVDPDVDQTSISSLVDLAGRVIASASSSISRSYLNTIMARRDILLKSAHPSLPAPALSSLRATDPIEGSLFGPHVNNTLKKHSQMQRELSLSNTQHRQQRALSGFHISRQGRKPQGNQNFPSLDRPNVFKGRGRGRGRKPNKQFRGPSSSSNSRAGYPQ